MKSAVILAVCTGLISCASISVPQTVGSPFTQQLLPQLNLNLPFSQAPQTNQLPQLNQVSQTNQILQLSQGPQLNQIPQTNQAQCNCAQNIQDPRYNDPRYNNNRDPRYNPAQNNNQASRNNQAPRNNPFQNNPRYDNRDPRYNNQVPRNDPVQKNQVRGPRCNPTQNSQAPRKDSNQDPQNNTQKPIQPNYSPSQQLAKPDDEYVLSWKWACRSGISFSDCQGLLIWNGQLVANIIPSDYNVHTATYDVKALNGVNRLRIEGSGVSSSYGLTIDDVSIVKKGSSENYVVNGDFETPNQNGVFSNIVGWTGSDIEIGKGTIYNPGWTSQVCELDGNVNSVLNQDITLNVRSG